MIKVKELIEALQLEEDKTKLVKIVIKDTNKYFKIYEFDYSYSGVFDIVIKEEE